MSDTTLTDMQSKTPWHLWLVAILILLWNGSGAVVILLAQTGALSTMSADEAAYYAAQSLVFVLFTNVATLTPIAGAVALLLRSKVAVVLFAVSLICICITNTWDIMAGTSRTLANTGALVMTCIILVLAILELIYARAMQQRGVLR